MTRRSLPSSVLRIIGLLILVLPLGGFAAIEAFFAPRSDLWPRWTAHDSSAAATIDHETWSDLLARYLRPGEDGLNRFAYGSISPGDRAALDAYIDQLSGIPIGQYNRAEQRAYWINLYNALTIQVVLTHYPVASIRDINISPGFFSRGPWGKALVTVEGEALTLDDIEHRILRPIWKDPRIHYAVNCAAVGCPNLQPVAFTAANAERLLNDGARAYVNDPRGVRFDGDRLVVSSIYNWFREDFGGSEEGILAHLREYARPELKRRLEGRVIDGYAYDWGLNDAEVRS